MVTSEFCTVGTLTVWESGKTGGKNRNKIKMCEKSHLNFYQSFTGKVVTLLSSVDALLRSDYDQRVDEHIAFPVAVYCFAIKATHLNAFNVQQQDGLFASAVTQSSSDTV